MEKEKSAVRQNTKQHKKKKKKNRGKKEQKQRKNARGLLRNCGHAIVWTAFFLFSFFPFLLLLLNVIGLG